jgi:ATP-dependent helicase/DNAse subunit B
MLVAYIRSSSYNSYDYCQQQYYINYVLGFPSTSGKKAQQGTIVHKVMECLSACKKKIQEMPDSGLMSIQDDALGTITFTKSILFSDEFVDELVDKSFEHYTSNCTHSYTDKEERECRKWTWMGLHYNDGQFDPRDRKIVDTEPHFDIEIDEPWAEYDYTHEDGTRLKGKLAIKGTIDLVTEVEDGVIEVVDWKTGRRINWATGEEKDYNRLESDPQLLLYYYAISKLYPDYDQAIMTVFYIKDGGPFSLCFDDGSKELFLKMLRKRFNEIKNNKNPKLLSQSQSHWKCTKLCDYYKNDWEGTNTNICRYVQEHIKKNGIERTTGECTKPDFNIGYYDAPG